MSLDVAPPEAAQRQAADPGVSVWVSASAGTGKTKVLTDRVLGLLLGGTAPRRILCLTFTRAAAAEMAARITHQLGDWTMKEDAPLAADLAELLGVPPDETLIRRARRLFAEVLEAPGGMNIMTLHAFCQSLLRRFPIEARQPPHFALMDERDADELLIAARQQVLARAQERDDGELAGALARVTAHIHEQVFPTLMAALAGARGRLARLLRRHGGRAGAVEHVRRILGAHPGRAPEDLMAEACGDDAIDQLGLRMAAAALAAGSATDKARGGVLAHWLAQPETRVEGFREYAEVYLTAGSWNGPVSVRKTLITKGAAKKAPGAAEILAQEAGRLTRVILNVRAQALWLANAALLHLGAALLEAYEAGKRDRALLDYDDLILEAGQLLKGEGATAWVLYKLDGGLDHILIDEAQDTSPEQWHIVDALAREFFAGTGAAEGARTVFAVGDVKQSIYSFQGAEPAAFADMRDHFAERVPEAQGQWREVDLDISFRSTRAVLDAVDGVFDAAGGAADGVSLDGRPIRHAAYRAGAGGVVELWPPVEPREKEPPQPWKPPVERQPGDSPQARLAGLVAGRIHRMISEGEELASKGRAVEAGDVLVLVRTRTAFVDELVRALKARDIDVAGADRLVLTEHLAVMDLMALGHFLLLPDDDLTLATVLKGPLFGFTEEQLFRLAHGREGRLWDELRRRRDEDPDFAAAADGLTSLAARADYVAPFEFYAEILGAGGGRRKLLARLGPDAADPIAEFLNLSLAFERTHPPSLEGFLYWLEAGAVEVKRDLEHAPRGAVRVMTVHGAKGLEAPIVFLPDTMKVPTKTPDLLWKPDDNGEDEALLWVPRRAMEEQVAERLREAAADRQREEYRRLLYVAMTRAEDRLYVCGWRGENTPPKGCWYELIADGLDGIAEPLTDPYLARAGETEGEILRLTCPQTDAVEVEPPDVVGMPDPLGDWAWTPAPDEPAPPKPLIPSRPEETEPPAPTPLGADGEARFKRGRLIHALLQFLPDLHAPARPEAARRYLARPVHGLDEAAIRDIGDETLGVLADPGLAALFGPGSLAEVGVIGSIGSKVVSGRLDRVLVTEDEILVVDFKTNRRVPERARDIPGAYLAQMAAYGDVLAEVYPGRRIRAALLWTDGPRLMWLD